MLLADDHFAYVSEMIKFSTGTPKQTSGEVKNIYMTAEILEETRTLYPKKIVLLWDNAGWHKGSVVQDWIKNV